MGTAGWAAPEAIQGAAKRASDVFSYGIMLWELLTWRPPSVLVNVGMLAEAPLNSNPTVLATLAAYKAAKLEKQQDSVSLSSSVPYDIEMSSTETPNKTSQFRPATYNGEKRDEFVPEYKRKQKSRSGVLLAPFSE